MDLTIKRTTTTDPDFNSLVQQLDYELWNELNEDQSTYDQHNKVPDLQTAVIVFASNQPAACGCFKVYKETTVEIKRMFVQKAFRGKGLSKTVLKELEQWAVELGYTDAILETSVHFNVAQKLYESNSYRNIDHYPPYVGLTESVCMGKRLK
jgi:putative acetyltransferase